jgi:two-component system response regulator YesN
MYDILIVEDERIEREALSALLQEGFSSEIKTMRYATNGEQALREFNKQVPDLVFLDIHIPKINGLELLERLSGQLKTEIIIVSAYSQFEYAQKALRLGVRDYLLKPVDTTQFCRVVTEVFDSLYRKNEAEQLLKQMIPHHEVLFSSEFSEEFLAYLKDEKFLEFSELSFSEGPASAAHYLVNQQHEFSAAQLLQFLVMFFQSLHLPHNEFLSSFDFSSTDLIRLQSELTPALFERLVTDFMQRVNLLIQQDADSETTKRLVKDIDTYLQEHFHEQINLEHLGVHVNRNPAYISRLYKIETGLNIKDRLKNLRISAARAMLEQGNVSVKEVAFSVGFSDPNYFSTVFKKETGLSATDYVLFYDKNFENN